MKLTPAEYVIRLFGGVRKTARALGRDPSSVSRWPKPKAAKGLEGRVPARLHSELLKKAETEGLDLAAVDLISGRVVADGH